VNGILSLPLAILFVMAADVPEITMDGSDDYIQYPYNTVWIGGKSYPTLEQGSGFNYTNGIFAERELLKASYAARRGGYGLDFTLPPRIPGVPYADSKDRMETMLRDNASLESVSSVAHYSGFSIKIPSSSGLVSDWFLIHQWHQSSPESPPISLQLLPGYRARLGVQVRHGANKSKETYFYLPRSDDSSGDTFIDLPQNKWIDFIVRWKFDVNSTNGCVVVYRHDEDWTNAVQIFNYMGRIGFTNVVDDGCIDEKFGLYRNGDSNSTHTIYYDQLRVGSSYNEVKPWP
jgi:hypothetical protein